MWTRPSKHFSPSLVDTRIAFRALEGSHCRTRSDFESRFPTSPRLREINRNRRYGLPARSVRVNQKALRARGVNHRAASRSTGRCAPAACRCRRGPRFPGVCGKRSNRDTAAPVAPGRIAVRPARATAGCVAGVKTGQAPRIVTARGVLGGVSGDCVSHRAFSSDHLPKSRNSQSKEYHGRCASDSGAICCTSPTSSSDKMRVFLAIFDHTLSGIRVGPFGRISQCPGSMSVGQSWTNTPCLMTSATGTLQT
jgi:hypothetical protein